MFRSLTRRKVIISLFVFAGILGVALIVATSALRSGYFERWLTIRVQAKLAEYGARLEIGSLKTNLGQLSFEASDLRAYVEGAREPFATVRTVSGAIRLRDILGLSGPTEIRLKSCVIEGLRARYQIDEHGRSNLDGLHPSVTIQQRFNLLYTSGTTTLREAEFLYLDRLHSLDGVARDVSLAISPAEREEMHLVAASRQGEFVYDGRAARGLDLDLIARITGTGANVESLKLRSPYLTANLKGEVRSWRQFDYQFEALADLNLSDFGQILAPGLKLTGAARFEGRIDGSGIDYQASGALRGEKLMARDVHLDGLAMTASGTGKGRDAKAGVELAINALEVAGFQVNQFSAVGEVGTSASSFDWRGRLRAGSLAANGIRATKASISRAQLNGPYNTLSETSLKGELKIDSLVTADVAIGSLVGKVTATADVIELPSFTGAFFGGETKGSARFVLSGNGQSELSADISALDVDQAIAAGLGRRLALRGKAHGRVDLRWPGRDYRGADGTVHMTFDGDALHSQGGVTGIPLNGTINVSASGRRFRVEQSVMRTGQTELRASGYLDWAGDGSLDVDLASADAAELQKLVEGFSDALRSKPVDDLVRYLHEYEIQLERGLRFQGAITGDFVRPAVTGRFALDSIAVSQESLGQLGGDLDYHGESLRVKEAVLRQSSGGQADFSLEYSSKSENSTAWRGRLRQIALGPLSRFATDVRLEGSVSGSGELSGIPGAMSGKGEFTIENAKYEDFEARELRGAIVVNGTRIEAQNASLRFAGGVVAGSAWFDTKTRGYAGNLHGEGLEIAELINATREQKIDLSGRFDIKLEASSEEFLRQDSGSRIFDRLTGSFSSQEIRYRAESIGAIQLTAKGAGSVVDLDLAAHLVGHGYAGAGKVDFSRKEVPVSGKIDLRDVALGPIVALISNGDISAPGTVVGEVRFAGNLFGERDPFRVEAELSTLAIDSRDMRFAAQPPVLLKLQGDQLDVGRIKFSGPDTNLEISGSIAIGEKGLMALTANGDVNLRLLHNFVQEITADGVIRVQMSASGTLGQPRLGGSATVENASLRSREFPLALTKGSGRLLFNNDQAQIASFTGEIGGGTVSVTGGTVLAGLRPDRWRLQARLNGVRIDYPRDFRTTADGELTLQGSQRLQVLSGLVSVRRGEVLVETDLFDLTERFMTEFSGGSFARSADASGIPPTQLDLHVVANDSLVVNNKSLDLVASADLRVNGSLEDPVLGGRVTISRGLIDELFKERYRITSGLIEFPGISQRPPRLSIDAETVISGYRLSVLIAGPFDNLRIKPRSEPPLPQADVIALMTSGALPREGFTGDSASQSLAQTQATNLSPLLTQPLSSRIGSNITGRLFGLNRFSIDPLVTGRGTDPTARITVGRRVTKDFSITYSTNLAANQDQLVLIEYRASDRLSFVASRAEDGAFGLDIRLRKRF